MIDIDIVIIGYKNGRKIIKIIDNSDSSSSTGTLSTFSQSIYFNFGKYKQYSGSIFFEINSINQLKSKIDYSWNLNIPKYSGWSGVGAVQCPSDIVNINYIFSKDDYDAIFK